MLNKGLRLLENGTMLRKKVSKSPGTGSQRGQWDPASSFFSLSVPAIVVQHSIRGLKTLDLPEHARKP